jgi:hypothetical protein
MICSGDTRRAEGDKDYEKHNVEAMSVEGVTMKMVNIHLTYTRLKINTTHLPNGTATTLKI